MSGVLMIHVLFFFFFVFSAIWFYSPAAYHVVLPCHDFERILEFEARCFYGDMDGP
jgi:hypothetical protein